MERLPLASKTEHTEQSEPSEDREDLIFARVTTAISWLKGELYYRNNDNDRVKLVDWIGGVSQDAQAKNLDQHLGDKDPSGHVVDLL